MTPVPPHKAVLRLAVGASIVVMVWGWLLPGVLELHPVQEHVALMEDRSVDLSLIHI